MMTTQSAINKSAINTVTGSATRSAAQTAVAAFAAILFGSFLLYGVGFAQPQQIHDAAHDARHSFAFPCH